MTVATSGSCPPRRSVRTMADGRAPPPAMTAMRFRPAAAARAPGSLRAIARVGAPAAERRHRELPLAAAGEEVEDVGHGGGTGKGAAHLADIFRQGPVGREQHAIGGA